MFGVRLWAEDILRIEWRCSSVSRLLCDVLFIFIKEKSCLHRYVLPNIERILAAWVGSWGIVSGMKRGNCAVPTETYFALSVSLHWSSISSIWRLGDALASSMANGLLSSSNLLLWSANRRVKLALSMPSFSANGNKETCSFIVLQHGKWPRFFAASTQISHRRSLVWNAFTAACISVITWPSPWN